MTPTETRLQVWRNGYNPLPLHGKAPCLKDWQHHTSPNQAEIEMWAKLWPDAKNTGILSINVPCLDLDILNPLATQACEEHIRDRFEDRGHVLTRVGKAPKFAVPFRTDQPFSKINLALIAADGIGQKIEFLGNGQQFAAFGDHPETKLPYHWHKGSPLDIARDDLPDIRQDDAMRTVNELGEIVRQFGYQLHSNKPGGGKARTYTPIDELFEAIFNGSSLHDPVTKIAGKMAKDGVARQTCIDVIKGLFDRANQPRYQTRWPECERAINDIYDKEEAKRGNAPVLLDDFYYHSEENRCIFMPTGALWPLGAVNARLPWIGGTKPSSIISNARPVEQATWMPGAPRLIKNKLVHQGGWIDHRNATVFNYYRPPVTILGDPANARLWIDHAHLIYPDEAEHIIKWCAHRVQHPDIKINHALVLGGMQGIGKDTLLYPVMHAVGHWNVQTVAPVTLLEKFNGHLKSVILLVSEARDLGEINRPQFYEHLKQIIAAPPDVLYVNEKNRQQYYIPNLTGVIITTNHKAGGIYLSAEDRRHFVAWSTLEMKDFDAEYFDRVWGYYINGGANDVAAYLAALDLSDFDPKAPPPKTDTFWEIVAAGRHPESADLENAIASLGWPSIVTLSDLTDLTTGLDPEFVLTLKKSRRVLSRWFEDVGYKYVNNKNNKQGLWTLHGRSQAVWGKSSISISDLVKEIRRR